MNIAIFGYSGFIGSHISKELNKINNVFEISSRNITYNSSDKDIFDYFDTKLINVDIIINCCANKKPKNRWKLLNQRMIPTGILTILNENESEERKDDSMIQSSHADIVIENVINNPYRR